MKLDIQTHALPEFHRAIDPHRNWREIYGFYRVTAIYTDHVQGIVAEPDHSTTFLTAWLDHQRAESARAAVPAYPGAWPPPVMRFPGL